MTQILFSHKFPKPLECSLSFIKIGSKHCYNCLTRLSSTRSNAEQNRGHDCLTELQTNLLILIASSLWGCGSVQYAVRANFHWGLMSDVPVFITSVALCPLYWRIQLISLSSLSSPQKINNNYNTEQADGHFRYFTVYVSNRRTTWKISVPRTSSRKTLSDLTIVKIMKKN